jgi:hypothetical protein
VKEEARDLQTKLDAQKRMAQNGIQQKRQQQPRFQVAFDEVEVEENHRDAWKLEGGVPCRTREGWKVRFAPEWMGKDGIREDLWTAWNRQG